MPDPLTVLRTVALATLALLPAVAFTSIAVAADQCLAPGITGTDQATHRDLKSSDGTSHIHVLKQSGQVHLCVQNSRCVWHSALASLSELGSFGKFADGDTHCQGTYDQVAWEGRVYVTDCKMPDGLGRALAAASALIAPVAGSTPCGSLDAPLTDNAVFTTVDGAPVFVASVPVNKLCFAVGIQLNGNFRTFATILRTCPGDAAAATAVALQWLGAGIPTSQVSIGASFSDGGFGLTSAGTAFDLVASTPVVLGPVINRAYVVTWLAAIKSAAGLAVAQAGGSPLEVSDNDAVGRLAKWLAAGLIRLDARPFNESDPNWIGSASARDWMTQTLLINPTDLGETLLRAENARLPWGAP